jgi:hypothetical protein
MNSNKLSRRRLLAGLLAGLTVWLSPRLTHASTPRPALPDDVPPFAYGECTRYAYECRPMTVVSVTYTYDASGRLVPSADHPPRVEEAKASATFFPLSEE